MLEYNRNGICNVGNANIFIMKKTGFLIFFILLSIYVSSEELYFLKLRMSYHPDFLRIVLEGPDSIISRAIVNQKAQDILVTFPDTSFTIQEEKVIIAYKINRDVISFFPEDFVGFKVFTLKYPSRLVIDIYQQEIGREEEKEKVKSLEVKTIVIDPGHGGYEYGIVRDNYREKSVVLDIAKKLKALISRGSFRCFLTRGSDRFMTLSERVKFTNNKDVDVFLSLHIGNHEEIVLYIPVITESVPKEIKYFLANRGQEEFMTKTAILLNAMQEAIISDFGDDMVVVKPLPYSILSKIEAAALIVELPSFEDAYYIEEFKTEIANTLYKGLYIYYEKITTR
jgi:hypothetical protein